jgi:hypothetical protein
MRRPAEIISMKLLQTALRRYFSQKMSAHQMILDDCAGNANAKLTQSQGT